MSAYNQNLDKFAGFDAQVMGMSIDSIYSHIAWQKHDIGWLKFPLGSDFYPHGEVAKKYEVFRFNPPIAGINERAIFIIDKQGEIVFSNVYELGEQPPLEEQLEVLGKLK